MRVYKKVLLRKDQYNFELALRNGDYITESRKVVGVPRALTAAQRKQYIPYLNVYDERGIVGTLTLPDLRRLRRWLTRVGL